MEQRSSKFNSQTFRGKVLEVVSRIPRGTTLSYKDVAELAGSPGAFRAVGSIMKHNHNPNVPCHRVILSDGRAGDYNGGSEIKIKILRQEGVNVK